MKHLLFIILIILVTSCSYNTHLVSGKYTVYDISNILLFDKQSKDTLQFTRTHKVFYTTRDTTISYGYWFKDSEGLFIKAYNHKIPLSVHCKDNKTVLLFENCLYEKSYINRTGVLEPIK